MEDNDLFLEKGAEFGFALLMNFLEKTWPLGSGIG